MHLWLDLHKKIMNLKQINLRNFDEDKKKKDWCMWKFDEVREKQKYCDFRKRIVGILFENWDPCLRLWDIDVVEFEIRDRGLEKKIGDRGIWEEKWEKGKKKKLIRLKRNY